MPERETLERAQKDAREAKSPSTQAGEFVREEIHHIREGKHGARSAQQAIAIGVSKARRAGVKLGAPKGPASIGKKAAQDKKAAKEGSIRKTSVTRALSRHAKKVAAQRGEQGRRQAAMKAARTRKAA
jgi:hypothetical protein